MSESVFTSKGKNFGPNFMEFIFDFSQHSIISLKKEYNRISATFSKTHTSSAKENSGLISEETPDALFPLFCRSWLSKEKKTHISLDRTARDNSIWGAHVCPSSLCSTAYFGEQMSINESKTWHQCGCEISQFDLSGSGIHSRTIFVTIIITIIITIIEYWNVCVLGFDIGNTYASVGHQQKMDTQENFGSLVSIEPRWRLWWLKLYCRITYLYY